MSGHEAAALLEAFRDETYPTDIFRPIPEEILPALDRWLLDTFGRRIDGLSAFYYRRVLSLAARVLRDSDEEDA